MLALLRALAIALLAVPLLGAAAGEPFAHWGALALGAGALAVAFALAGKARFASTHWSSPLDRLIFAGLALCLLQSVDAKGSPESMAWLRQISACALVFYAIHPLARRTHGASEALWGVFAVAALTLGLHAMWACTAGLARLGEWSARADAAWMSEFGLGKTLLLSTLLCAGRAGERASGPLWRAAALVGGIGTVLHAAVGGLGLGAAPLGLLEHPLYFSVTVTSMLLLATLTKRAWQMCRDRPHEAWRWRGAAFAFAAVAALAALGGASGGEAMRLLTALAAVTTLAAAEEPAAVAEVPRLDGEELPELESRRAA